MPSDRRHPAQRGVIVRRGWLAAPLAVLLAACGTADDGAGSAGPAIVLTSAPDTPDVKAAPLPGVWVAAIPAASAPNGLPTWSALRTAGAIQGRTNADGRATLDALTGAVRICEFGNGDVPTTRAGSCVDATVADGSPTALTVGDAGLSA